MSDHVMFLLKTPQTHPRSLQGPLHNLPCYLFALTSCCSPPQSLLQSHWLLGTSLNCTKYVGFSTTQDFFLCSNKYLLLFSLASGHFCSFFPLSGILFLQIRVYFTRMSIQMSLREVLLFFLFLN